MSGIPDASFTDERTIVNAAATLTRLGGSVMSPQVVAAMADAATRYVDLPRRARDVGARIARLTGNADAVVTAGASAGLTLAVASAVSGPAPDSLELFPRIPPGMPDRVVMLAPQRNAYDYSVRLTGATIVEAEPSVESLRRSIDERTACVLWFAGTQYPAPGITLEEIVSVARGAGVPVIVDAAAQVPPVSSLWSFTVEQGASLAIFSGGKGLRGPQAAGLVVGDAALIEGCRAHAAPNHGIGRSMKVGKEELAGMLAAVEAALNVNEAELLRRYEAIVQFWLDGLADLAAERSCSLSALARTYPSEAGQPHGRAELTTREGGPTGAELEAVLWEGDPRVAVLVTGPRSIALNPQPLLPDEEQLVLEAVRAALVRGM